MVAIDAFFCNRANLCKGQLSELVGKPIDDGTTIQTAPPVL